MISEDYRLEECAVPEIGEGEMLVKILAVGICAGDAKCYAGVPYFWGKKDCRHNNCTHVAPRELI